MPLTIRPAMPDDIDDIVGLIVLSRQWQERVGQPVAFRTDRRPEVTSNVERGEAYVALEGPDVIATFALEPSDPLWPDADAMYFHRLAVDPGRHGRGYGGECLAFAERAAARMGKPFLRLDAVRENDVLCAWYERRGYVQAGYIRLAHWSRGSMRYQKKLT